MQSHKLASLSILLLAVGISLFSQGVNGKLTVEQAVEITTDNFQQILTSAKSGEKNYLIFVGYEYCGFCASLKPIWNELGEFFSNKKYNDPEFRKTYPYLAHEYTADVIVAFVDVVESKEIMKRFDTYSFPQIVLFAEGLFYEYSDSADRSFESLRDFAYKDYKDYFPEVFSNGPSTGKTGLKILYKFLYKLRSMWRENPYSKIWGGLLGFFSVIAILFRSSFQRTGLEDYDQVPVNTAEKNVKIGAKVNQPAKPVQIEQKKVAQDDKSIPVAQPKESGQIKNNNKPKNKEKSE